ncbi:hypothetical protein GGTG_10148 [Gaeumannomyces tritici R3-111a-1]|uniref:Uncharacterized protein n=1 Tax=Gaeumannomyces tritici (strain R3-111a-1) TaxID=644352 RepID=J3P9G7_GAET3|nr:hypothetical protein GGTG_10148 [Gaeumannomyces tritici R3-111a-1]EJT73303.1 hypothetical protein GGTG_10148 [Gaeumannomyces tritici R3-111a-1]
MQVREEANCRAQFGVHRTGLAVYDGSMEAFILAAARIKEPHTRRYGSTCAGEQNMVVMFSKERGCGEAMAMTDKGGGSG